MRSPAVDQPRFAPDATYPSSPASKFHAFEASNPVAVACTCCRDEAAEDAYPEALVSDVAALAAEVAALDADVAAEVLDESAAVAD